MDTETLPELTEMVVEERRKSPRADVVVQARLECGDTVFEGSIVNLSFGGACFVTTDPDEEITVGAAVVLTLVPPPNAPAGELHWTAKVVRRDPSVDDGSHAAQFGLQFDQATPSLRRERLTETQPLTQEL